MSNEAKTREDQTLEPMDEEGTDAKELAPPMPALCMGGVRDRPLLVTETRGEGCKTPDELPADVIPYIETIPAHSVELCEDSLPMMN